MIKLPDYAPEWVRESLSDFTQILIHRTPRANDWLNGAAACRKHEVADARSHALREVIEQVPHTRILASFTRLSENECRPGCPRCTLEQKYKQELEVRESV